MPDQPNKRAHIYTKQTIRNSGMVDIAVRTTEAHPRKNSGMVDIAVRTTEAHPRKKSGMVDIAVRTTETHPRKIFLYDKFVTHRRPDLPDLHAARALRAEEVLLLRREDSG